MLTVDFERLDVRAGQTLLDIGAGLGRHTFEALRRGARVIAMDLDAARLREVSSMAAAMEEAGELPRTAALACVVGDVTVLPVADASLDRVIASEILEHIGTDERALAELERVLKPGGRIAVTVPRAWPERICWALSKEYSSSAGGHVRIYSRGELTDKIERSGVQPIASHHAHSLHSPYWWIRCLVGVDDEFAVPTRLYKRFLEWQIVSRPKPVDALERALDPVLGKSLVVYALKPLEREVAT